MKNNEFIKEKIAAILNLPRHLRVKELFRYIGSTQDEVTRASGRSKAMVSYVFTGSDKSSFVAGAAYNILQHKLGELCPSFEDVFAADPEPVYDRLEKQIVHG
jgi:hypothetical protein